MPALEYFLVCRAIQRDILTDEVSLISVLEDVAPEAFPHVIARAVAVSLWNLAADEPPQGMQATLVVKVPGQPPVSFPMNFSQQASRYRAVQGVLDIPIAGPGELVFEVLLNGTHAASHSVRIHPSGERESLEGGKRLG